MISTSGPGSCASSTTAASSGTPTRSSKKNALFASSDNDWERSHHVRVHVEQDDAEVPEAEGAGGNIDIGNLPDRCRLTPGNTGPCNIREILVNSSRPSGKKAPMSILSSEPFTKGGGGSSLKSPAHSTDCRHLIRRLIEIHQQLQSGHATSQAEYFRFNFNELHYSRHKLGTTFYMPRSGAKCASALTRKPERTLEPGRQLCPLRLPRALHTCLAGAAHLPCCKASGRPGNPPGCSRYR